jgi:hypothetical protein
MEKIEDWAQLCTTLAGIMPEDFWVDDDDGLMPWQCYECIKRNLKRYVAFDHKRMDALPPHSKFLNIDFELLQRLMKTLKPDDGIDIARVCRALYREETYLQFYIWLNECSEKNRDLFLNTMGNRKDTTLPTTVYSGRRRIECHQITLLKHIYTTENKRFRLDSILSTSCNEETAHVFRTPRRPGHVHQTTVMLIVDLSHLRTVENWGSYVIDMSSEDDSTFETPSGDEQEIIIRPDVVFEVVGLVENHKEYPDSDPSRPCRYQHTFTFTLKLLRKDEYEVGSPIRGVHMGTRRLDCK